MKPHHFLTLFLSIFLFSCENNETEIDPSNLLLGNWSHPTYKNETTSFKRTSDLPLEDYGIAFLNNGDFIEHSSGFCGTPPLVFSDFKGTFTLDDNLVKVNSDYFPNNFQWEILKLTKNELVVKIALTEQENEHRVLMGMYNDISNLAYGISCVDASDWKLVAYGAKACGGPQGFLPYSTTIDTVAFLQKVEVYTNAEKAFNKKWNVVSDCAVVTKPKSIDCKNGFPTLTY